MSEIRTITGSISPKDLGFTDSHGHLIMDRDLIISKHPDFKLDHIEKIAQEVGLFMKAGGRAMVEMSCIGVGRNPKAMLEVARRTGLNVIASTGLQREEYYLDSHWRNSYSVDQIASIFVDEIEMGLDNNNYTGPYIDRLDAKAGVIKIGTNYQHITDNQRKVIEAAAIAHKRTGSPIATHTEMGTMGLEQVEVLSSFGVDPKHVVIGHMDRNPDFYVHRCVAETGAFLCYDTPGRVKYFPETTFLELLRKMVETGFGNQLLWGGDVARRSYFVSYGGGPGLDYVPKSFVKRLRAEGFAEQVIEDLFVNNPAEAFGFA
jgi:predicted metal-dependent phosphotriesterase family hydrolase